MVLSKRKNFPLIRYTSRDFESIKKDLVDYKRRYYPNISRDEAEASFDELMFDSIAYVGDNLSYYLDYNINESFLDTAVEFNNILKLGKSLGYKFKGNPTSTGIETFFAIIPANISGLGPDPNYLFTLKKDTELSSTSGNGFILNEDVNFAKPTNEVVVARVDENTGLPTAYAVKAFGRIISGKIVQEIIDVGDFQKFLKIELAGRDISEIVSVLDDEGNEYFEVDYLSQDIVYKGITNRGSNSASVPFIMRPFAVPRRFIVERERTKTFLQFGFGSERDVASDPLVDPSQVILDIHGKNYVSDSSFDPTNILGTDKLGIVPANTRLRITYRINTNDNVNAATNSITEVTNPIVQFNDINSLNIETVRSIIDSIECTNEEAIIGDVTFPSVTELKLKIFDRFGSQNRAVTLQDYRSLVYSMPPKFGAIKRCNVIQDPDSFKRNLNMYVISEDVDGTLVPANSTLKENLKIWINQGKMINDTIDLFDAKIVNLGIDVVLLGDGSNKFDVLKNALTSLRRIFDKKEDIGDDFSISKIYDALRVRGVIDILKVKIYQKHGTNYADTVMNLDDFISPDGKFIQTPANIIFEIKYPDIDCRGSIK